MDNSRLLSPPNGINDVLQSRPPTHRGVDVGKDTYLNHVSNIESGFMKTNRVMQQRLKAATAARGLNEILETGIVARYVDLAEKRNPSAQYPIMNFSAAGYILRWVSGNPVNGFQHMH